MRAEKMNIFPFDLDNNHFVKIFMNDNLGLDGKITREFVIKSKYCIFCS